MSKVLYITANPDKAGKSYGLQVGRSFIEEYKALNPEDTVVEIDLFDLYIPQIDGDITSAWDKLGAGKGFEALTAEEARKVKAFDELSDEFIAADKYVLVTPLWNFAIPTVAKAYLDTLCVPGKTFNHTKDGVIGLLKDKKLVHIQASGGIFSHGPGAALDHGNAYVKTIAGFIGITDVASIFVEGTAIDRSKAEEIKAAAIKNALEVAKVF